MATDRRVKYTKMIIKDSLINLLNDQSMDKLTVKLVCLKADINRATFYRHYSDIYDLFKEIEDELKREVKVNHIEDIISINLLTIIYNNKGFYKEFFRNNILSSSIKEAKKFIYSDDYEMNNDNESDLIKSKYNFDFFIYGIEGLIKEWIEQGCLIDPYDFSKILKEVSQKSMP